MKSEIKNIFLFYKKNFPNLPSQAFTVVYISYISYLNIMYFKYMYSSSFDQASFAIISLFFYLMSMITYFLAALTDPSQNNLDNIISQQMVKGKTFDVSKKEFQQKCDFCKMKKHDRSSHCSFCSTCILRRDHHCVFIGKCVGLKNTRFFLNFLFWCLVGDMNYIVNYIHFYNNLDKLSVQNPMFNIGYLYFTWLIFIIFIAICGFCGILFLFVSQLNYIYNDSSYLDRYKSNKKLENYYCLIDIENEKNDYNAYNKGFILNYYNLVGPSLLHIFLPLPIFTKHDVCEQNENMKKNPFLSVYDKYLYYKVIDEDKNKKVEEENLMLNDPDVLIQETVKNYESKVIN